MNAITAPAQLGASLLDRIGNTPLLRLDKLTAHLPNIQLLGKVEWVNPGGSIKDRAASGIVQAAILEGQLTPGSPQTKSLLDATSGNTGIAYAMLGSAMDFPVTLCMPSNVSPERKNILAAHREAIIVTILCDSADKYLSERFWTEKTEGE
jgi:cysteine synthase B